jgi:hypothetical protein
MEAKPEVSYSLSDVMQNLKQFIFYIIRKWWLLLLCVAFGAGLGAWYHSSQKSKYKAITTFILEEKSGSGGGLAGLASQFGISLGGLGGGGSFFAGDNILSILKSKKVVQNVLMSKAGDSTSTQTMADLYLDFTGMKKKLDQQPHLAGINFSSVKGEMNPVYDSLLNAIQEDFVKNNLVIERTTKQGSIIKVQVNSGNSKFARLMSEGLVSEAARLYLDVKTGTAEANIASLQQRSDSLLMLLNRKSFTAAATQQNDLNPALKTAIVPTEIATRDKTVLATLYAEVTKNLEASKLILSQQTPVIQLLDRPSYLLDDNKKGILFLTVVFGFAAGFLFVAVSFLLFLFFGIGSAQTAKSENNVSL